MPDLVWVPSAGSFKSVEVAGIRLLDFEKVSSHAAPGLLAASIPRVESLSNVASVLRIDEISSCDARPTANKESLVVISPNISLIGITWALPKTSEATTCP